MQEYLINVFIASRGYWSVALFMYAAYKLAPVDVLAKLGEYVVYIPKVAMYVFLLGTLVGITSPSNTYKNTVDYNKNSDLATIKRLDESDQARQVSSGVVIRDLSTGPQTPADRAGTAVDMRDRVTATPEAPVTP